MSLTARPRDSVMRRRRLIGLDHFGGLLVVIIADVLLAPVMFDRSEEGAVAGILTGLLLVGSLVATGAPRRVVQVVGVTAFVLVTVATSGSLVADGGPPAWAFAIVTAMLAATPVLVLRRVLNHQEVTLATVAGALCAYMLVGVAFSALYRTIEIVDPDAFTPVLGSAATYFSFITLATVGYGDYVPAADLCQSLVVLEAVIGQVLLVTLVARFVTTLGQQRVRPARVPGADQDDEVS